MPSLDMITAACDAKRRQVLAEMRLEHARERVRQLEREEDTARREVVAALAALDVEIAKEVSAEVQRPG